MTSFEIQNVLIKNNKNIFVVDRGVIFKYSLKSQEHDKHLYYEVTLNSSASDLNSVQDLRYKVKNSLAPSKLFSKKQQKVVKDFSLLRRLSDSKKGARNGSHDGEL